MSIRLNILCPDNNHSEREYILLLFFEDFLGLPCTINFRENLDEYVISYHQNKIIIEDHFFNHFSTALSYLDIKNIPESFTTLTGYDLPIIFGRDYLTYSTNEIRCGIDIFASSFFFLTRWEEFVVPKGKDGARCDESQLFVVKNNLFLRPIVNEYLDFLIHLFLHFGTTIAPNREFTILQTHDVDRVYLSTFSELFKNLKPMIRQKNLRKKAIFIFFRYMFYRLTLANPFMTFDDFMDFSDSIGLQNSFFFMAANPGEKGHTYTYDDPRVVMVIENIENRGHHIGFHPSESTINNDSQFLIEYNRLSEISSKVEGGRQHHLLYDASTFLTWDKYHLGYDSGLGFQYRNGFRCGSCYDFPIFDIYSRKKLALREIPFTIMDTVFVRNHSTIEEMESESKAIIDTIKRYNGMLCTVWHTNLFNTIERKKYKRVYYKIINYVLTKK